MKELLKQVLPEEIWSFLKRTLKKEKEFTPTWNTLSYDPVRGVKMFFDPASKWGEILDGSYDDFLFKKIRELDLEGKIVFDIGACIGFHSFYFARLVGEGGKVLAFEPNRKNIERINIELEANPDIAKRIRLFDIALSDKKGIEEFIMNENVDSARSSGSYIESADTAGTEESFKNRGFIKEKVRTLAIDMLPGEYGIENEITMMKIDVEGAESLVLKGAEKTIERYRPVIFVETHSEQNLADVTRFFASHSYEIETLKKENEFRHFIEARPKKTL